MADGNELVLSELKEIAKTHRASFAKGFQTWKNKVEKEGEQRGYLDPQADRMAFAAAAFAFVAIVAAGAAAVFSGFWWFFLGIPVGIVLIFVARAVKRRSQEAAELHAQYAALRALPQGLRPAATRSRRTPSCSGSSSSSSPSCSASPTRWSRR